MSVSRWLDQSAESQERNFDTIVVGGGVAGLSVAYWLQVRHPRLRVALIERHRTGFGASGRNAGFVTCGSLEHFIKLRQDFGLAKATEIWKFSEDNHRLLREHVIGDDGESLDYRRTGSCTVAPSPEHWEKYREVAAVLREQGIDMQEIGPVELEADYGVTGFAGGIQYRGDGFIHPIKLLNRIRSRLQAEIFESTEVFALQETGGRQMVRTDRGVFKADRVILTLNAYLPLLLKEFESLVTPGRGQILLTEPLPAFVKGPCYLTKHLCYFRQLPTGHLLIGGFRNKALEAETTYTDQTTALIQDTLLQFVRDHFRLGREAKAAYQWSGIMGFSRDGQMLLGPCPGRPGVHVMAGCSGHGMGLSFNAARVLVAGMEGDKIPEHLRVERFFPSPA